MTFEKKTEPIFKRLTQALLPYSRSLGLAILFLGLISCESEFEAFEPGPTSFGVYGYLDTAADTQFVRVIPIRRTLERDGQGFEGTVTITNLDTGEAYVAQDSVMLSDSTLALAYWAAMKPKPTQRYRLDVVPSDGAELTAQTRVPELMPGDSIYIFPARLENKLFYPVYLLSLDKPPFDLRFVYEVSETPTGPHDRFQIRYPGDLTGRKVDRPDAWYLEVDLSRDSKDVRQAWIDAHGRPPATLYLHGITILAATVSDEWIPPGGIFDLETLIMPGTYGNIEGGEGFFGAVARYELSWVLADPVYLAYAGYGYLGDTWGYIHPPL